LNKQRQEKMVQKVPCKQCGAEILPITADKTDGLCMQCYKKADRANQQSGQRWKVFSGLVIFIIIIIIVIRFSCGPHFPVGIIHVAPGKSATCNLKANKSYVGTYYVGSASAEILTKLPAFLHVQTDGDMEYGFVDSRTVGNPEVTLTVSADTNATLGIYKVKGRWQCVKSSEDFRINIEITQEIRSSEQHSFEDFLEDINRASPNK
jgi:uncharacterized OB-fold protein